MKTKEEIEELPDDEWFKYIKEKLIPTSIEKIGKFEYDYSTIENSIIELKNALKDLDEKEKEYEEKLFNETIKYADIKNCIHQGDIEYDIIERDDTKDSYFLISEWLNDF